MRCVGVDIGAAQRRIVATELMPLALSTLKALMADSQPWAARLGAAKGVLHHAEKILVQDQGHRDVMRMTLDELDVEFKRLLAERDKHTIDITPDEEEGKTKKRGKALVKA